MFAHMPLYSYGVLMPCDCFKDGLCVHTEAVAMYGATPSPGTHAVCPFNTTGGVWPLVQISVPILDPATREHLRKQARGCHGCGDAPPEGMD